MHLPSIVRFSAQPQPARPIGATSEGAAAQGKEREIDELEKRFKQAPIPQGDRFFVPEKELDALPVLKLTLPYSSFKQVSFLKDFRGSTTDEVIRSAMDLMVTLNNHRMAGSDVRPGLEKIYKSGTKIYTPVSHQRSKFKQFFKSFSNTMHGLSHKQERQIAIAVPANTLKFYRHMAAARHSNVTAMVLDAIHLLHTATQNWLKDPSLKFCFYGDPVYCQGFDGAQYTTYKTIPITDFPLPEAFKKMLPAIATEKPAGN